MALGVETNYHTTTRVEHLPVYFGTIDTVFCGVSAAELLLRMDVRRSRFVSMNGWCWNLFDLVVVGLQLTEQVCHLASLTGDQRSTPLSRVLRVVRLLRVTRVLRVVRLVEELRTLASSIAGCIKSLGWTLLLLMMLFTQIVLNVLEQEVAHRHDLEH